MSLKNGKKSKKGVVEQGGIYDSARIELELNMNNSGFDDEDDF